MEIPSLNALHWELPGRTPVPAGAARAAASKFNEDQGHNALTPRWRRVKLPGSRAPREADSLPD